MSESLKLVLLGPPGSGKGTQAQSLAALTGAQHIATGDLVRAEIAAGTELGSAVKAYNDRGDLVPDQLILDLVKPALSAAGSWILDGFPRDVRQAEDLDALLAQRGEHLDRVIVLKVPDVVVLDRLLGRRLSVSTGRTYHLTLNPPPPEDRGPFIQRTDDTRDDIVRRLDIYHRETEPLEQHYAQRRLLSEVNADAPMDVVTDAISKVLFATKDPVK